MKRKRYTEAQIPGFLKEAEAGIPVKEFGRRGYDNADAGTDHGWGNNMLVIGGGVNGGKFYGPWPGLAEERLFQGADIFALTDYRTIFSEVLRKRLGNNQINTIFPDFTEAENPPLGVISGPLPKPEIIFRNGFE